MAKSLSKHIERSLSELLQAHLEENPFFILGVSGGPDSMALLYLFHKLDLNGLIVHINYAKRGKEAELDQELVEQFSYEWGFECCSLKLNPDDAQGENFQNWARKQRYQFFRDLKTEYQADGIMLAHHQDDQIETILQKIFRGSSPSAWQGMQHWDGELFRPLLSFSKQDILDFCEEEAIPFRTDESNKTTDYARNLIRNELAIQMDDLLPGWRQHVLNLPEQGALFESAMNYIAGNVTNDNSIALDKFNSLPALLKSAVLKTVLDNLGFERSYSKGQLEEFTDLDDLQTGKSFRVGNHLLTRDRDSIRIHPVHESDAIQMTITQTEVENGWSDDRIDMTLTKQLSSETHLKIDADALNWPLQLRSWEAGDAFIPLGMSGSQKVSDHLTNRKIPTISREKALVLCGSDSTIYAIIYPLIAINDEWGAISESAKITPESTTYLTINIH